LVLMLFMSRISAGAALAGLFQLFTAFMLVSMAGNCASILTPYRVAVGSLKPTKTSLKTALMIFLSHLLFPVVLVPIFIPPVLEILFSAFGWMPALPVNLLLSLALAIGAGLLYRTSLHGLGALLQRRERSILQIVTAEVE